MIKPDIIIGLFSPLNQDLTPLYNRLRAIGEVRLITIGQTNLGPIDLLVYPDNMGVIPTIGGLYHNKRTFIPSKPIHPHFLLFWEENPVEKIMDGEERGIPIIGVGDAAAMLYDTIGGLVIIDDHGQPRLLDKKLNIIDSFNEGLLYGAMDYIALSQIIKDVKEDILIRYKIPPTEDLGDTEDEPDDDPPPKLLVKAPIPDSQ